MHLRQSQIEHTQAAERRLQLRWTPCIQLMVAQQQLTEVRAMNKQLHRNNLARAAELLMRQKELQETQQKGVELEQLLERGKGKHANTRLVLNKLQDRAEAALQQSLQVHSAS